MLKNYVRPSPSTTRSRKPISSSKMIACRYAFASAVVGSPVFPKGLEHPVVSYSPRELTILPLLALLRVWVAKYHSKYLLIRHSLSSILFLPQANFVHSKCCSR
ncbi:hypothetical protein V6Z11_A11G201100 [Gossypium hirsutum]